MKQSCMFSVLAAGAFWLMPLDAAPAGIGAENALTKVRPGDAAPEAVSIAIEAASNEFEPFQVIVDGGDGGVTGVIAEVSDLAGPGGAIIPAGEIMLYCEGLYEVVVPSNIEGAVGPWPDPLIPGVDAYFGETRSAFPFDVPAGELRGIWIEVFVPPGTEAGSYTGTVSVSGIGLPETSIAVSLRVRGFEIPSTATLKSAFGVRWNVCASHLGSYEACGDAGIEQYQVMYGQAALDHRVTLESVVYYGPDGTDWTRFDATYGPMLDGTAGTRLSGARLTTLRVMTGDAGQMALWHDHFDERGWLDRLFDYTCDEPPAGCGWDEIPARAAAAHGAGIRTLVTTDIDEVNDRGLHDDIDILVPVVNYMHPRDESSRRPDYDGFLTGGEDKELWMYQSCMSHGCGDGCVETAGDWYTGWPSYMIDTSALQNRAMQWIAFIYDIGGELYFATTHDLPTAWDDQCDFSGNGDGTLFYPGTPDRIGGSSHIPVESIRLKLIREGMEDFEYLSLLCSLGDCDFAREEAAALFPAPYQVTSASPEDLYAARTRIADRIEEILSTGPTEEEPDAAEGAPDAVEAVDIVETVEGEQPSDAAEALDGETSADGISDAAGDDAGTDGPGESDGGGCGCRLVL